MKQAKRRLFFSALGTLAGCVIVACGSGSHSSDSTTPPGGDGAAPDVDSSSSDVDGAAGSSSPPDASLSDASVADASSDGSVPSAVETPADLQLTGAMMPFACPFSLCQATGLSIAGTSPILSSFYLHSQSEWGPDQSENLSMSDMQDATGVLTAQAEAELDDAGLNAIPGQNVSLYEGMTQLYPKMSFMIAGSGSATAVRVQAVRGLAAGTEPIGPSNSTVGYKLDFENLDVDLKGANSAFGVGIYDSGGSSIYPNTASFSISGESSGGKAGWHNGIHVGAASAIEDTTFRDSAYCSNSTPSVCPGTSVTIAGTHSTGVSTASSTLSGTAINLKATQQVCLGSTAVAPPSSPAQYTPEACLSYTAGSGGKNGTGKLAYTLGGKNVFSVSGTGAAKFAGPVMTHQSAP